MRPLPGNHGVLGHPIRGIVLSREVVEEIVCLQAAWSIRDCSLSPAQQMIAPVPSMGHAAACGAPIILDSSAILTKGEPSMTITGYAPDS